MFADEHGNAFVAMLVQQWEQVAMPERKHDRLSLSAHSIDAGRTIDDADPPCHPEHPQKRHAESDQPSQATLAFPLCSSILAEGYCIRGAGGHQLASRRSVPSAISSAIVATRPAAPAVPKDSRTRASSATICARSLLLAISNGSSASATALG